MTTWARSVNNQAADVTTTDPSTIFHPAVSAQFMVVTDGTKNGATFANGAWTNPPTPAPMPEPIIYPMLTPMQYYLAFTPSERIAIKGSSDPVVKEAWATYELAAQLNETINPNLVSVQEALSYFTTTTPPILASTARIAQILAGIPQ